MNQMRRCWIIVGTANINYDRHGQNSGLLKEVWILRGKGEEPKARQLTQIAESLCTLSDYIDQGINPT